MLLQNGATGSEESTTPAGDLRYRLETGGGDDAAVTSELKADVVVVDAPAPRAASPPVQARKRLREDASPASAEKKAAEEKAVEAEKVAEKKAEKAADLEGDDKDDSGVDEATNTLSCAICTELIVGAWACGCGAGCTFCKACIEPWVAQSRSCPSCNAAVGPGEGHRNVMVDQMVALLVKKKQVNAEDAAVYLDRKAALGGGGGGGAQITLPAPPPPPAPPAPPPPREGDDVLVIDSDDEVRKCAQ